MTFRRLILLTALAALLAGCGSAGSVLKQPDPVKNYFALQAERGALACSTIEGAVLKIRRVNVAPTFSSREFIYRVGPEQYQSDYYNLFLVQPKDMLTEAVYEWFSSSGQFSHVVPGSSALRPDFILESNVTRLYGDYSTPGKAMAVFEVQFFLLQDKMARYKVAFCKNYHKEVPIEGRSAAALASAFEQSLKDILGEVEGDVAKALGDADTQDHAEQQ